MTETDLLENHFISELIAEGHLDDDGTFTHRNRRYLLEVTVLEMSDD